METQKLFERLDALCLQAVTEAQSGDASLVNSFTKVTALSQYFNNVYSLQSMSRQTWGAYAGFVKAAEKFFEEYDALEEAEANKQKVSTLESELAALKAKVDQLFESKIEPAPVATKKNGKAKAAAQDTMDTEEESAE